MAFWNLRARVALLWLVITLLVVGESSAVPFGAALAMPSAFSELASLAGPTASHSACMCRCGCLGHQRRGGDGRHARRGQEELGYFHTEIASGNH